MRVTVLALALVSCRGVFGIDEDRPLLDAGTDGAGSAPRFCETLQPAPRFCADFEGEGPLTRGFSNEANVPDLGLAGGGAFAEASEPRSGRRAAGAVIPALVERRAVAAAELFLDLPGPLREVTVQAAMRPVTEYFPQGEGTLVIAWVNASPVGAVAVVRQAGGTRLRISVGDPPVNTDYPFDVPLPVGVWHSLEIGVMNHPFGGNTEGRAFVVVDGIPAANGRLPSAFTAARDAVVSLGAFGYGPLGAARVELDEVRIDWPK